MDSIEWEWDDIHHHGVARVSPHVVAVVQHDEFGWPSPLVDGDCYTPCHINVGYRNNEPEGSTQPETPTLTREQIRTNASRLNDVFGTTSLLELAQKANSYYYGSDAGVDAVNDAIDYELHSMSTTNVDDYHEALKHVYAIAGIDCLSTSSVGYSPGDYASLFLWVPPEKRGDFENAEGDTKPALEGTAETVTAWLWGDVYGYTLYQVRPSLKTEEFDPADHEPADSCCGFYGRDHEESGLNWNVRDMAQWIDSKNKKARETIEQRAANVASVWRNARAAA